MLWRKLFITADGGGFWKLKEGGMNYKIFPNYKIISKLILLLGVLALLFAIPLSAAENVKIKLPDGLYMYNSWIAQLTKGGESVRFEKFFVVQNNTIYSSQEAIRKFGILKLNKLFTENKKYKILLGGGKIGEIQNLEVDDADGHRVYKEELLTKNKEHQRRPGISRRKYIHQQIRKCSKVHSSA